MSQRDLIVELLIEDPQTINYNDICARYNISKELLLEMMEHGLFSNQSMQIEQLHLSSDELAKIETAFRLRHHLGVNLPGIVLALELLDKIEHLDGELSILRKHF